MPAAGTPKRRCAALEPAKRPRTAPQPAAEAGAAGGGGCGLLLYAVVEALDGKVPIELSVDATVADLKTAVHAAGGPEPHQQVLAVGAEKIVQSGDTPLSDTLVSSECVITARRQPVLSHKTALSCSSQFGLALLRSGQVVGWRLQSAKTVPVPDFDGAVTSVHAGDDFSAAIVAGKVVVWGSHSRSVQVDMHLLDDADEVVCVSIACAVFAGAMIVVDASGRLYALGEGKDEFGEIPAEVQGRAVAASAGSGHVAVLTREGTVVRFGEGVTGTVEETFGTKVPVQISAGEYHCSVLLSDGTVRVFAVDLGTEYWDSDDDGDDCSDDDELAPPEDLTDVVYCVSDVEASYAVRSDGSAVRFGSGGRAFVLPKVVPRPGSVAVSDGAALVLTADGKLEEFVCDWRPLSPVSRVLKLPGEVAV